MIRKILEARGFVVVKNKNVYAASLDNKLSYVVTDYGNCIKVAGCGRNPEVRLKSAADLSYFLDA